MPADFRYRKFGYLALAVTDIDRTSAFAQEVFGLDFVREGAGGARMFRSGPAHHDIVLTQADGPGFLRGGWELETDEDLEKAFAHYEGLQLRPKWLSDDEANDLALEKAFRVRDPIMGATFEYYSKMTVISSPRTNRLTQFQGGKHIGFAVPDCKQVTDYMVENMGFLVSDYLAGWHASLLRAFPNPNHHSFAPLQMPGGKLGFHHIAFMVESIDDIGLFFNRIRKFDLTIQFGIGRHPTSGSIHLYVYDPDYIIWEYTLGMEQFPEAEPREPRRMSANPEDFDLWQAVPDREFAGRFAPILQDA